MADLDRAELLDALDAISPEMHHDDWVQVGMALHHEGCDLADFDAWSARDTRPGKYSHAACTRAWQSFENDGRVITGKYIFKLAYGAGWQAPRKSGAFDWDDVSETADEPAYTRRIKLTPADVSPMDVPDGPPPDVAAEVLQYLRTLFKPDEFIGYILTEDDVYQDDDGKWKPGAKGHYARTCKQICDAIERHPDDITAALGTPVPDAGAWVRINPLDGHGVHDSNVTGWRYALVECDSMEPGKQLAIIRELHLPCAAIVTSGNKSIHAIVRVDADNADEYRQHVADLYKYCKDGGLPVDAQNRNPSRLSRLPGFGRGEHWQRLVAVNDGPASWDEWDDWRTGLPAIENFGALKCAPTLAPELIHGILRDGQKMMLTGPSKAGKSFALIQLACAIARGWEWFGFQCEQGHVLYANFEISRDSFNQRVLDVYTVMKREHGESIDGKDALEILRELKLFDPWSLRGYSAPLDTIEPKLLRRASAVEGGYRAIILDPIYKLLTGDENSASDMAKLCNTFDRMTKQLGGAAIYAHHHPKGDAASRDPVDRGSGSGVFARDPDALIDMTKLHVDEEHMDLTDGDPAYRIEFTLREFESPRPVEVVFDWPVHRRVEGLEDCSTTAPTNRGGRPVNTDRWAERNALVARAIEAVEFWDADAVPTVAAVWGQIQSSAAKDAERLGITQEKLADWTLPSRADGKAKAFAYTKDGHGGLIRKN